MNVDQLKEKIKKIPVTSGIYIFKNSKNKPLYIGKALNLKNRVKSYLRTEDIRLQRMINEASKINFIETKNDIEALILESQYIKKCHPNFNIMLRDDKQYGFVTFTNENYPRIFITHQPTKSSNTDFIGPFTNITALKTTLRLLRRIFPYCTCKQPHNNYCLNYHISNCMGICCLKKPTTNNLQLTTYNKNIRTIKDILSGKRKSVIKQFEKEMQKLGKAKKFEETITLQDKIEKLKKVFQNAQTIRSYGVMIYHNTERVLEFLKNYLNLPTLPHRIEAYDVANIQGQYAVGAMVVFENGIPNKNEYRKFRIRNIVISPKVTTSQVVTLGDIGMLKEVLTRRFRHTEWPYPNLIVVDGGKNQLGIAQSVILNFKFKILNSIKIIALAKNEKHIGEKIFIADRKNAVLLSKLPAEAKNLFLRINSEAHRFAISYYRKVHRKISLIK